MRATLLLALLLAALFAVAGCGGDSKEDIAEKGNEICKEADEKGDDLEEPESLTDYPAIAEYSSEAGDIIEDGLSDFEDLDPPDEDKDKFDDFISASEDQLDGIRELEDAAEAEDEAQVEEAIGNIEEADEEADQAAEDYGMEECAND